METGKADFLYENKIFECKKADKEIEYEIVSLLIYAHI